MALSFADIKDEFIAAIDDDTILRNLMDDIQYNHGSYGAASEAAARIGDILGAVLKNHEPVVDISEWDLEGLIPPALGLDHSMVTEICLQAQTIMNEESGLGIRAVTTEFDGNRAYGIVDELRNNPEFFNIEKSFYEQLTNFSQSIVDQVVRKNAELQSKAGVDAYVVRTAEPGACPWCRALAGTYKYDDVRETGSDVWRRHDNCRCVVTWYNGRGGKQLVSSKEYHYRGSGGEPGSRSNSSKYRMMNYDTGYDEFSTRQINSLREAKGWTYEQALGYFHKNERFYKSMYYGKGR